MPKFDFNFIKEKTTDIAKSSVSKSYQVAEMAKIQLDNVAEEDAIKKAYMEIGRIYFEANGNAPDNQFASACKKIEEAKENIEANNIRIYNLRNRDTDEVVYAEEESNTQFEVVEEETQSTEE